MGLRVSHDELFAAVPELSLGGLVANKSVKVVVHTVDAMVEGHVHVHALSTRTFEKKIHCAVSESGALAVTLQSTDLRDIRAVKRVALRYEEFPPSDVRISKIVEGPR